MRRSSTVSTVKKSQARIVCACARQNCRHVGPVLRGAGSRPARCRMFHTVAAATRWPRPRSSPWMRRWPQVGFSRASRSTKARITAGVGGRPPVEARRRGYVQRRVTSSRCQRSSVAGATIRAVSGHRPYIRISRLPAARSWSESSAQASAHPISPRSSTLQGPGRLGAIHPHTSLTARSTNTKSHEEAPRMSALDKAKNAVQDVEGKAKEAFGKVTGHKDTESKGKGDQAKADLKDAGEKVKDAFNH